MADGICRQVEIISWPTQLGSRCLRIILAGEAPSTVAAVTYSCCFRDSTCPLIIRDMPTQYSRANVMKILTIPTPREDMASTTGLLEPSNQACRGSLSTTCSSSTISTSGTE